MQGLRFLYFLIEIFLNISNLILLYRLSRDSIRFDHGFCVGFITAILQHSRGNRIEWNRSEARKYVYTQQSIVLPLSFCVPFRSSATTARVTQLTAIALSAHIKVSLHYFTFSDNPIEEKWSHSAPPLPPFLPPSLASHGTGSLARRAAHRGCSGRGSGG